MIVNMCVESHIILCNKKDVLKYWKRLLVCHLFWKQFSRAIRKVALSALSRCFAANFAHEPALISCICATPKMCKHILCRLRNAWLNCFTTSSNSTLWIGLRWRHGSSIRRLRWWSVRSHSCSHRKQSKHTYFRYLPDIRNDSPWYCSGKYP